jgi:hypothetical protein
MCRSRNFKIKTQLRPKKIGIEGSDPLGSSVADCSVLISHIQLFDPFPHLIFMSLSHNNEQTTSAGALAANPSGKRKWSDGEMQLFEQGLKLHGRNWTAIAATIPGRTALQVQNHANSLSQKAEENATEKNTGPWSVDEKQLFVQGIELHGRNWTAIAATIPGRTALQVQNHANSLSRKAKENATEKNTGPWSVDEEQLFVQGYKLHGRDWTAITATIPSRTVLQNLSL